MSTLSKQALVDAVNNIVGPAARRGELHTLTLKLVRKEVEQILGLEAGATSAPEYKSIIKEATENAKNVTGSDVGAEDASVEAKFSTSPKSTFTKTTCESKESHQGEASSNGHSSSPVSTSKRKRSLASDNSPPKPAYSSKRPIEENSDDASENDEEYESESDGELSKKARTRAKTKPRGKMENAKAKGRPKSRASTSRVDDSDGDMEVDDEESEKEQREESAKLKGTRGKPKPVKTKSTVQYKSAEYIATSDMEQDEPFRPASPAKPQVARKLEQPVLALATKMEFNVEDGPPSKRRRHPSSTIVKDEGDSSETEKEMPGTSNATKALHSSEAVNKPTNDGDDSETGLSDLIDEPPRRKKQAKSTQKPRKSKETSARRTSSSKPVLSKDEETVKRLKTYVLACGVRKVWAKLFKDLNPKAQIAKLKEMLAELGMIGRYTMEKAKAIKQKREFEKELEDVQEFAKSMEARDKGKQLQVEQSKSEEESEEEEVVLPRTKRGNARNSIAAFLQEQSDSE